MQNENTGCLNYEAELARAYDEKTKLGLLYEELSLKCNEQEKEIAHLKGQVKAFEFCVAKGR